MYVQMLSEYSIYELIGVQDFGISISNRSIEKFNGTLIYYNSRYFREA